MKNDLVDRLKKIQSDAAKNYKNIPTLTQLAADARKAFNDTIDQLMAKNGLVKKIGVPRQFIKLWSRHGRRVQIPVSWRYLLSAPFIYGMIIPAVIWHIGLEIYHQICFRLYGIPRVQAREYFVYDRQLLSWLNPWEKVHCYYCSYVNNLVRYSSEIAGRTERFWCPIKYYLSLIHI